MSEFWENLGKSGKIWELSKKFLRQFGINLGQFGIVLGYKETMYLNASAWTESREQRSAAKQTELVFLQPSPSPVAGVETRKGAVESVSVCKQSGSARPVNEA